MVGETFCEYYLCIIFVCICILNCIIYEKEQKNVNQQVKKSQFYPLEM